MTRRSRAREVALQLLFGRDHNAQPQPAEIERFVRDRLREPELRTFCMALYQGVVANAADIDACISAAAENWRLQRMATVDRNALRLGTYELLFTPATPPATAITEAMELARRFGTADSPAFVNGVLDKIRTSAQPAPADAAPPS